MSDAGKCERCGVETRELVPMTAGGLAVGYVGGFDPIKVCRMCRDELELFWDSATPTVPIELGKEAKE